MKSSSRALAIFGGVLGLLIVVTLVLVLVTANQPVRLLPESSPEGVVQRYFLAIDEADYATAWSYLAPRPPGDRLTFEDWQRGFAFTTDRPAYKATLGETKITGEQATVEVVIDVFRRPGGLFDNPVNTNHVSFFLRRESGSWKIIDPIYAVFY